jgi:hypothetical protein
MDGRHHAVNHLNCSLRACQACARRIDYTWATRRPITVRPREPHRQRQAARPREQTEGYLAENAQRAGIAGTLSQAVRASGARRARYIGAEKTSLQPILTAAVITCVRGSRW